MHSDEMSSAVDDEQNRELSRDSLRMESQHDVGDESGEEIVEEDMFCRVPFKFKHPSLVRSISDVNTMIIEP